MGGLGGKWLLLCVPRFIGFDALFVFPFLCTFVVISLSWYLPLFVSPFPLPVCTAYQVSVTVRLACLSMASSTRDAGHHSRFVSLFCRLPARYVALASMALPVGATHRVEP